MVQFHSSPRLRCDHTVTSALRGGISEHPGIPTVLKRQPLRPNRTELNCLPSGSTAVSATQFLNNGLASVSAVAPSDLPKVPKRIELALLPQEQAVLASAKIGPWRMPTF